MSGTQLNDWTVNILIETHFDSVYNGKMLYFPWYFGDLDRVETGVSEEGINSLKTLPKSSKTLPCVKALILTDKIEFLHFDKLSV